MGKRDYSSVSAPGLKGSRNAALSPVDVTQNVVTGLGRRGNLS